MANDYSIGFDAYINKDFEKAEQHWLLAAKEGDAKAMFNLGLLYDQSKLNSSRSSDAENWYRKAADNGYHAANFHLAQRLFERGGSDDLAIELVNKAAKEGYAPAIRFISKSSKARNSNVASKTPDRATADKKAPVKASQKSVKTNYLSQNWIDKQKPSNWTIQLLAFKEESKVKEFIDDYDLSAKAAYFVENKDGIKWYKLIYGSYDSKDKASLSRQNLPKKLQEFGPWLRTLSSVQELSQN